MDGNVLAAAVIYRDAPAALEWLERAFGFETTMAIDPPPGQPTMGHYEMDCGVGRIMIGSEWTDSARSPASVGGVNTQSLHIGLAEGIDAHCERARAAGATIVQEPEDQFYGDRTYRVADLDGHVWTFSQHVRDVSRAEAEAAIGTSIRAKNWS